MLRYSKSKIDFKKFICFCWIIGMIVFFLWLLLCKMVFKKKALISFWCWSKVIISNCRFSRFVLILFWRMAVLLFSGILFATNNWALVITNCYYLAFIRIIAWQLRKLKHDEIQIISVRRKPDLWIQKV